MPLKAKGQKGGKRVETEKHMARCLIYLKMACLVLHDNCRVTYFSVIPQGRREFNSFWLKMENKLSVFLFYF